MLRTLRSTIRATNLPLGRIVSGAAAVVMSTTLVAPAIAQQQKSEEATRQLAQATGMQRDQLSVYEGLWRTRLEDIAKRTLTEATATVQANQAKADASAAQAAITDLDDYATLANGALREQIDITAAATDALAAAGADADRRTAEAEAIAAANANTPDGARATARDLARASGWGEDQFQCLDRLWTKESNWNYRATNGSSGATGIPQALPGNKMATFGSDWATNATTQIKWGLDYINRGYGTPCSAWSHSQSVNWY